MDLDTQIPALEASFGPTERSLRCSQRLLKRDLDDVTPLPLLPAEIIRLICSYSEKSDLKQCRLVSKIWRSQATSHLFDRVYVSARRKDLEVFEAVTSHSILSLSIKEIRYDVSVVFGVPSKRSYFELMCREIRSIFTLWRRERTHFTRPRRLVQLVKAVNEDISTESLYDRFHNDPFVTENFEHWTRVMTNKYKDSDDARFLTILIAGMRRLPNLASVNMEDNIWSSSFYEVERIIDAAQPELPTELIVHGSPCSRRQKLFQPYPHGPPNKGLHFDIMFKALACAQRELRQFTAGAHADISLPPGIFQDNRPEKTLPSDMMSTLCSLERLDVAISPYDSLNGSYWPSQRHINLPCLVGRMTNLRHLFLKLDSVENKFQRTRCFSRAFCKPLYTYPDIFPWDACWPDLSRMQLSAITLTLQELQHFLLHQVPNLKRLWLHHIYLLQGRWEEVVELLRHEGPWELIALQGIFRGSEGQWWPCHPNEEGIERAWLGECHDYINHGGKLPVITNVSDEST